VSEISVSKNSVQIDASLSYDAALAQLERILDRLESGDLPLEETLRLYEEGALLAKLCAARLDEAELRVQRWQEGNQTAPFDEWRET